MGVEARTHRLVVPRTARYSTLGAMDGEPGELWFLCHGYGQLAAEFLESARALAHPERVLVAPEGLSRFYHEDHRRVGASWMTREDRNHEMDDYVRYLDLVHEQVIDVAGSERARVTLLGYSQGAATASRWAARGRVNVHHLVLWGAALPPELDDADSLAPLATMRLTLVGGRRDQLFPESARAEQRARLERHGIPFSELSFDGGHRLDDDTLIQLTADVRKET